MGNVFTKKLFLVVDLETFCRSFDRYGVMDNFDDYEIIQFIRSYCGNFDVKVRLYRWVVPYSANGVLLVLEAKKRTLEWIADDVNLGSDSYRIVDKKGLIDEIINMYC